MLRKALREANLLFLMSPPPRWAACWLVSELVAKKGRRLWDAVQLRVVVWWRGDEVNRTEWLFISRCSGGNGLVWLLRRWETDVRLWEGPLVSTLPPADTCRHWNDVRAANVWVPNRCSGFWGLLRKLRRASLFLVLWSGYRLEC